MGRIVERGEIVPRCQTTSEGKEFNSKKRSTNKLKYIRWWAISHDMKVAVLRKDRKLITIVSTMLKGKSKYTTHIGMGYSSSRDNPEDVYDNKHERRQIM